MDEERTELDFDLDLNADPYNPTQDKSKLIKGIIAGVAAVIVIVFYFYLTSGH